MYNFQSPNQDNSQSGFKVARGFGPESGAIVTLPKRQTFHSAGYDISAAFDVEIPAGQMVLVSTGLKCKMPLSHVLKLYIRSSMAVKKNLMLANNVGIIDSDYFENQDNDGHIMVPLINMGQEPVIIKAGERIAQGIVEEFKVFAQYELQFIQDSPQNVRNGGFGSTGQQQ